MARSPDRTVGALLCVIDGPTGGRPWSPSAARTSLRHLAVIAGIRRRFAPHQLRHAHAVEMAREGVPLPIINSDTPTSGSRRSTSKASITARSSTPSSPARRRCCPPAPDFADRRRPKRKRFLGHRPAPGCRGALKRFEELSDANIEEFKSRLRASLERKTPEGVALSLRTRRGSPRR